MYPYMYIHKFRCSISLYIYIYMYKNGYTYNYDSCLLGGRPADLPSRVFEVSPNVIIKEFVMENGHV